MKGIIYKITCNTGKFYIGSTLETLARRMTNHKCEFKRTPNMPLYYHINEIGGWDHVSIEVLEEVEVETLQDLHFLESIYLRPLLELCNCLNDNDAYRTKEERKQYSKEWYKNNREVHNQYQRKCRAKKKAAKALICLIE